MTGVPFLRIGPIDACVEAEAVRLYRLATAFDGRETGEEVPATFPAIWLWHPAARAAFEDLAGEAHLIPVLIAQRFCYRRSLRLNEQVRFVITRQPDANAERDVLIAAHVEDLQGGVIADFSATYRLFFPEVVG